MVSGKKCKKVWANRSGGPYRKQLYVNFAALIWSCMGSTVLCGKELLVACGVYRFLKYFCSPMADHQVIFRCYDEPVQDKVIQKGTYTGKPLWAVMGFRIWSGRKYQLKTKYTGGVARDQITCSAKRLSYRLEFYLHYSRSISTYHNKKLLCRQRLQLRDVWEVKVQFFSVKCSCAWRMTNVTVPMQFLQLPYWWWVNQR